jgi:hypothetical protein
MKRQFAPLAVLCLALWGFETPNVLALQTGQLGQSLPCGSSGTLFTNTGNAPTEFDLGADWSGQCQLSISWTDQNGNPQTITLTAPPPAGGASSSDQPSAGASSSLAAGGAISWTTAAGSSGPYTLNVHLVRPLSTLDLKGQNKDHQGHETVTFGTVSGMFGPINTGYNTGENVRCGSSGALYTNLTSDPIYFDLMVNNQSPSEFIGPTSYACSVSVAWTDATGNAQTINIGPGASQGALSTSLPPSGVISWTSSSAASQVEVAAQ